MHTVHKIRTYDTKLGFLRFFVRHILTKSKSSKKTKVTKLFLFFPLYFRLFLLQEKTKVTKLFLFFPFLLGLGSGEVTVNRPTLAHTSNNYIESSNKRLLWVVQHLNSWTTHSTCDLSQQQKLNSGSTVLLECYLTSRCCARVGWLTVICLFLCIFLCHMMLRHIFFPLYFVINSVYKKRQRENNFSPKIQDKTKVIFFSLCFFIVFDIFKQACVNNVLCACYTSAYYGFIEILPRM